MNQTPNYALNQWAASDQLRRVDVNADNAKIDAALGTLAAQLTAEVDKERFYIGSYTGDGTTGGSGNTTIRTIPLPWTPKILLVSGYSYISPPHTYWSFTVAFGSYHYRFESSGGNGPSGDITIVNNGFCIDSYAHNIEGKEEHFIAIR